MDTGIDVLRSETLPQALTLQQSLEAFLLRCKAKNLSQETLLWYGKRLRKLNAFLESKGVSHVREITPHLLRLHLEFLREANTASGTVFRTYGAMRCYFGFLARERFIPASPMTLVEKPRKAKRIIEALTLEQAQALLAQPNRTKFPQLRAWTMMVLFLDSGLRLSEILSLRRDQINFQSNMLRVIGKGDKEREVPFSTTTKQVLWQYLSRLGNIPGQDLVFLDQYGRGLKPCWVEQQIKAFGIAAKIEGVRVSPHSLRHTFATEYIRNGGDPFSLQAILGHTTLDMVRVYVNLASRDVALQHRKFSPIDQMGVFPGMRGQMVAR